MNPYIGLTFDIIITLALGVTIFHAVRLSRQFEAMRADKKAFEALIAALNLASARAEASIRAFKETAGDSGDVLQDRITRARGLADELEIVIQAGDSLADRLQGLAEKSREAAAEKSRKAAPDAPAPKMPETPKAAPASSAEPRHVPAGTEPRTRAEKELLDAIRAKQQS